MKAKGQELAERIAERFCQEKTVDCSPIVGRGFVNQVYSVETRSRKLIVRLNTADRYAEYVKEEWCIRQAAAAGIPGPTVLAIGVEDGYAYMLQSWVKGVNGLDTDYPENVIWRRLGEYARLIHAIPVQGYGGDLENANQGLFDNPPHPGSDGSWQDHIRYNIDSLNDSDPLLARGVITENESRQIKTIFEQLAVQSFQFGLIHGDLSVKNVLVEQGEGAAAGEVTIALLDWGAAEVHPVPHGEVIQLMQTQFQGGMPNHEQLEAFYEGYGLPDEQRADTKKLMLLRAVDTLRWAVDRAPEQFETFAGWVRHSVRMNLDPDTKN
ncbi:aminoglycoside phosphotransferase family protein [Saccharibacillus deserti]|uniref:aminoglycoside phosphotransferase family protein n=1 Tax=Saccharibacillus deserti TaxID=1634444 RepID=UPI001555F34D|nr:aminoglycoside phosphotransferase family protein [Saccharibacillus deserti]